MMDLDEKPISPASFFLEEYTPGEKPDADGRVSMPYDKAVEKGYLSSRISTKSIRSGKEKTHCEFLRCPYCGEKDVKLNYEDVYMPNTSWAAKYTPSGVWKCDQCGNEILYVVPWPDHPNGMGTFYLLPAFLDDYWMTKLNDATRDVIFFMSAPKGTSTYKLPLGKGDKDLLMWDEEW